MSFIIHLRGALTSPFFESSLFFCLTVSSSPQALEKRSHPLAEMLLTRYAGQLGRDPSLLQLAQKCKETYAPAPVAPGMGGLSDMFRMLMAPS